MQNEYGPVKEGNHEQEPLKQIVLPGVWEKIKTGVWEKIKKTPRKEGGDTRGP